MSLTKSEIKKRFELNTAACEKVLNVFSLLSNKSRFRIMCMLCEGDFCVNEIVEVVQPGKVSNISQQLRLLMLSGYIEKRREKKHVIYHLKDQNIRKLIQFLEDSYPR